MIGTCVKRLKYSFLLKMLIGFLSFFFLHGLKGVILLKGCPPLSFPRHGRVRCLQENGKKNCVSNPLPGSVAEFTCEEFYRLSSEERRFLECRLNGRWSSTAPFCVPDCGRRSDFGGLIVNGVVASRGAFPWHVAIYNLLDGSYEYWCGGSLISELAVITAAHCAWEISPNKLMLVFGKFHRNYNFFENTAQKIKAKKIEMLSSYQDVMGNYNGDVAVVFLEHEVRLGHYSAPVCIDWDQRLLNKQLAEGTPGAVLGWGLTENDTLSDILRVVMLPVVSDKKCIAEQEQDFKKFVTYTSFCAGFGNGTGVCNGDSGGGLTFFDNVSARWFLQGLVSVSPRKKGTPNCDLNFYTIFTKVSIFSKWLLGVKEFEKKISAFKISPSAGKTGNDFRELFRWYFEKGERKKIMYPHSTSMLQLAGFSKRPRSAV